MLRLVAIAALLSLATMVAGAQSDSSSQAAPAKPATKAAPHPQLPPEPVAVFDTTVGKLRCTLFEKETPITVKNFIDLATGAKDWTNPVSHATKHNTPLYDGTIFHRVIPNFMIQGGDPRAMAPAIPATPSRTNSSPPFSSIAPGAWPWRIPVPTPTDRSFCYHRVPPAPERTSHHLRPM